MPKMHGACSNTLPRRAEVRWRPEVLCGAIVVACGALLPHAAAAQAQPIVAVAIVDLGSDELARKLRAESTYAGFVEVTDVGVAGEVAATGATTRAAVRLRVVSPERVVLEFSKPNDAGAAQTHELVMLAGEGDAFALRTVEFARARLVDLGWQIPQEKTEVAAASESSAPAAESEPAQKAPASESPSSNNTASLAVPASLALPENAAARATSVQPARELWIGVGAAGSAALGGFAVSPQAALTLQADLADYLGVNLRGVVPVTSAAARRSEGAAQLSWYAAVAGVHVRLPLHADWPSHIGIEGGLSAFALQGDAAAGFAGRQETLYAGTAAASFDIGRRLNDWLRLRASVSPGFVAPRPVVRFDAREVATIGRFYCSFGLSLEAGFDWRSEEP
jgi:hypothetical protein